MIGRLKTWAIAALIAASSILASIVSLGRARREAKRRQQAEAMRGVEKMASDALSDGLKREGNINEKSIDTSDRRYFE